MSSVFFTFIKIFLSRSESFRRCLGITYSTVDTAADEGCVVGIMIKRLNRRRGIWGAGHLV